MHSYNENKKSAQYIAQRQQAMQYVQYIALYS